MKLFSSLKFVKLSLSDPELWRAGVFGILALCIVVIAYRDRPFRRAPKALLRAALAAAIVTSPLSPGAGRWLVGILPAPFSCFVDSIASSAACACLLWLSVKFDGWVKKDDFVTLMGSSLPVRDNRATAALAAYWIIAILGAFLGIKGAILAYCLVSLPALGYAFVRTMANDMELKNVRVPFAALLLLAGPTVMLGRKIVEWTPFGS